MQEIQRVFWSSVGASERNSLRRAYANSTAATAATAAHAAQLFTQQIHITWAHVCWLSAVE